MAGVAAVSVDDDLAARQAGITLGAAHHKLAGGVHQEAGVCLGGLEGQIGGGGLHHMGPEVGSDALAYRLLFRNSINLRGVLGGDQDRVDRHRAIVFVDDAHLGLAVRQQVTQAAVVAHLRQAPSQAVGQADRQGHQLGGLIAGVAKHDPLISRTDQIQGVAVVVVGLIHPLGDVRRLLIQGHQHRTAVGVEAAGAGTGVADLVDHPPHQGVEVHPGRGGDFAGDQAEARIHHGFAGHPGGRVLGQQGIEHRIAHLVTDFVGVTFGYRLGGEDVAAHAA